MIRVLTVLIGLGLATPMLILDSAAQGISRGEARAIARDEARRARNSQRAQEQLGLGASGQSRPVITSPSQSGSFNASGQYRAGSGTLVTPNR